MLVSPVAHVVLKICDTVGGYLMYEVVIKPLHAFQKASPIYGPCACWLSSYTI